MRRARWRSRGTIWLNHFLRTGFEMFTAAGQGGYVAERAETSAEWLFPVGDEVSELGYVDMFSDIAAGRAPQETLCEALEGPEALAVSAGHLRRHPSWRVTADSAAAALLGRGSRPTVARTIGGPQPAGARPRSAQGWNDRR